MWTIILVVVPVLDASACCSYERGWFQILVSFSHTLGKIPILTDVFFRWVVQSPTSYFCLGTSKKLLTVQAGMFCWFESLDWVTQPRNLSWIPKMMVWDKMTLK